MKDKKGFTLIEVLVTITILALITIILVPTVLSVSKSVRQKALDTKINEAEEATILWAQDNKSCLISDDEDCMIDQNDCSNFNENGVTNEEIKVCRVTIGALAENNLIKNDGKDNSGNIIILNPVDKDNDISDTEIEFTYNTKTKIFNIYSMNFVYTPTTKKTGASKTTTIKSLVLNSDGGEYNAQNLDIKLTLNDPYGGNVKVCITNTNDINSCASWEDVSLIKRKNKDYTKTIDLTTFNSDYTTGSGENVTLYVFVKNEATNEDNTLYSSYNVNYKLYKYCDNIETYDEGTWSACPVSCGGGTQSRTSKRRDKFFTNIDCGDLNETKSCNTMDCCSSTTTSYSSWSSCSASCGGGTQTRTKTVRSNYNNGVCSNTTESQSCNTQRCCTNVTRWTCNSPTVSVGGSPYIGGNCYAVNPCYCTWNGYYYNVYSGYVNLYTECV